MKTNIHHASQEPESTAGQENTKQLEALFNHATIGIVITGSNGAIVNFNKQAELQFGYAKDEALAKNVELLLPASFQNRHEQYRQGFYQHPQNRAMGAGRDLYARKKDGTEFPVEISLSHYRLYEEIYVLAFVVDITVRKNSEALVLAQKQELEQVTIALQQLNKELEQKVQERTMMLKETLSELEKSKEELKEALSAEKELGELKSRFVAMASHEFRTPLSTILSSLSLIGKYTTTEDQDKRDKHILRSKEAIYNMRAILEDFLSLSKLEEGRIEAHFSEFDIQACIKSTVEEMQGLLKPGQQIIHHHHQEQMVRLDPSLLKNILINLLSNAVKFSPANSSITVCSAVDAEGIRVSVKDEGMGISADDLQHLSERFFRARNAQNIQGTGLGLHIVSRYLELMKGRIECYSELGNGTVFTVSFGRHLY